MSSRRQKSIPLSGRYRQVSMYLDTLVHKGAHCWAISRRNVDYRVVLDFCLIISNILVEQSTLFKWPTRTHESHNTSIFYAMLHNNDILPSLFKGVSLGMRPTNERRLYIATTSLIGWPHLSSICHVDDNALIIFLISSLVNILSM